MSDNRKSNFQTLIAQNNALIEPVRRGNKKLNRALIDDSQEQNKMKYHFAL